MQLVSAMTSIHPYYSQTSGPHRHDIIVEELLSNVVPFFSYSGAESSKGLWMSTILANTVLELSPNIFNDIQVQRPRWPVKALNAISVKTIGGCVRLLSSSSFLGSVETAKSNWAAEPWPGKELHSYYRL